MQTIVEGGIRRCQHGDVRPAQGLKCRFVQRKLVQVRKRRKTMLTRKKAAFANAATAICALLGLAVTSSTALAGQVTAAPYGTTQDGRDVVAYTLINDSGASATILDFGGTIAQIRVPDRHGRMGNVVISFADLAGWEAVGHANAHIGRYANRFRNGIMIDGVHYPLQQNASGITLHGGPPPYSTRIWQAEPVQPEDGAAVTLALTSPAGDQGFPGTVTIRATYRLTDDNALRLDFTATTDAPTVINLTNHIYFNLNGNSTTSVYGHRIALAADRIAVKDGIGMLTGELRAVAGTALDAAEAIPVIRLVASAADPAFAAPRTNANPPAPGQLRSFDHSYAFPSGWAGLDQIAARLEDDDSGRVLELRTSEPSIQVFVPANRNGLSDVQRPFRIGPAIALETQHLPDSPNQPHFPSTMLRPGEVFQSTTIWDFGTQGEN
jgi:aldose 1-epimerase